MIRVRQIAPVLCLLAWQAAMPAAAHERIVAIGGSITEIVFALEAEDRLVAVDSTSLYPKAATELPDVGYIRRLSAEPILALEPDLVLALDGSRPETVLEQIREAGVDVSMIADDPSPEGIAAKIREVAGVLGLAEEGEALAAEVETAFQGLASKVDESRSDAKVMFFLSAGRGAPMVGGLGTSADAIIRLAGGQNAVTAIEGYKPLSPEAAIEAAPEVLLAMDRTVETMGGAEAVFAQPDLAETPASRGRALVTMDGLLLLGFGPRTPEAAQLLAEELARFTPGQEN